MTMTPILGSRSSVAAPQMLLPWMDLVAANPQTPGMVQAWLGHFVTPITLS